MLGECSTLSSASLVFDLLTRSHVAQAGLELVHAKDDLISSLHFLSAGISGICYHVWLLATAFKELYLLFLIAGDLAQGLPHARQVFYH